MSVVTVDAAGQEAIERAVKMLAGIDGGINKALRDASSRAASKLRTGSVAAIREQYAISASNVRANQNVTVKYSYQDGVQASVNFHGTKIPLYRYIGTSPASPTRDTGKRVLVPIGGRLVQANPSLPAHAHQKKSTSPKLFSHAYVLKMKSGHVGIFARTGETTSGGGDAIKEIMGAAPPQMVGSKEVSEKLGKEAAETFVKRLDHNVLAILSGYMR